MGGDTTSRLLGLLANRGTLLVYGGLDPRQSMFSTIAVTARELTIKGVAAPTWVTDSSPQERAADIADLFDITRRVSHNFDDYHEFALSEEVRVMSAAETGPRRVATILATDG